MKVKKKQRAYSQVQNSTETCDLHYFFNKQGC